MYEEKEPLKVTNSEKIIEIIVLEEKMVELGFHSCISFLMTFTSYNLLFAIALNNGLGT